MIENLPKMNLFDQNTFDWQHKLNMEVSNKQVLELPILQSQVTSTICNMQNDLWATNPKIKDPIWNLQNILQQEITSLLK